MRIQFVFDTDNYELHAVSLARILLDIQHMAIVSFALAKEQLPIDDIVFDDYKQKYSWMIEAQEADLGGAALLVTSITMASPLKIELGSKNLTKGVKKAFIKTYRYITEHLLFTDLEREKRSVDIEWMREQVLEQRIKNFESALNLTKKIPDENMRQQYLESLRSSVYPFIAEHPPIKEVKLIDDTSESDDKDDDIIIDSDDSKPS